MDYEMEQIRELSGAPSNKTKGKYKAGPGKHPDRLFFLSMLCCPLPSPVWILCSSGVAAWNSSRIGLILHQYQFGSGIAELSLGYQRITFSRFQKY